MTISLNRLDIVRKKFFKIKVDGLLISNPSNIFYLSGFHGSDSFCLITKNNQYILTDFRYTEEAKTSAKNFDIIDNNEPLLNKLSSLLKKAGLKTVGFESKHLSFYQVKTLESKSCKKLIPLLNTIEELRIIKNNDEISIIKKVSRINLKSITEIIKNIKIDQSEKLICAKIERSFIKNGADSAAFSSIVASGENSSKPHAKPTNRRFNESEPITIDCGAKFQGYNSDITRSFCLGQEDKSFKRVYNIVDTAQKLSIDKVKAGVKIADIDKIARDYISKKGYAKNFGHSTGHGVGIDVHELPLINRRTKGALKPGMVFTIEPGIYIQGWGGVRIEDMVLVTENKCMVIT